MKEKMGKSLKNHRDGANIKAICCLVSAKCGDEKIKTKNAQHLGYLCVFVCVQETHNL